MRNIDELIISLKNLSEEINKQLFTGNYYEEFERSPIDVPEEIIDQKYAEHEKNLNLATIAYYATTHITEKLHEFQSEKNLLTLLPILEEKEVLKAIVLKDIPIFFKKIKATYEKLKQPCPDAKQLQNFIVDNAEDLIEILCQGKDPFPEYAFYFERLKQVEKLRLLRDIKSMQCRFDAISYQPEDKSEPYLEQMTYLWEGNFLERTNANVGYCGEHASLALVRILNQNMLLKQVEVVLIEYLNDDLTMDDNHVFLAINRDKDSKLNDITSWGEEAVLFDSWNKLVCKAKDFNSLPYRYYSYPAGLQVEGVWHCAKWSSIPLYPKGQTILEYIQREDTYYRITGNADFKTRELNIIDEYQLFCLDSPLLSATKCFLEGIIKELSFDVNLKLFITTAGNELITPVPGLSKPTLAIHKDFLLGLENKIYTEEEIKFGLTLNILKLIHYPIQLEDTMVLADLHFIDWEAVQKCKCSASAISYLQKSSQFQARFKDNEDFKIPYSWRFPFFKPHFGERIKLLNVKLVDYKDSPAPSSFTHLIEGVIQEVNAINKPIYFNNATFQQCENTVEKLKYLTSKLPELKKELLPFEITHKVSVRLREYCALLEALQFDLSSSKQDEAVDELLNTAFELKIPSFDLIYKALSGNILCGNSKKSYLKMMGPFKAYQQAIEDFVYAKDFNAALEAAKKIEVYREKFKNHYAYNRITENLHYYNLYHRKERFFGSTIGTSLLWKGFVNKYDILVEEDFPKNLNKNTYLFILNGKNDSLYFIDNSRTSIPIAIDEVKDLSKFHTIKSVSKRISYILKCVRIYACEKAETLPWDNHINWAKEDHSRVVARSLWSLGVVTDMRLWGNFTPNDIMNFISPESTSYIRQFMRLRGELSLYSDMEEYDKAKKKLLFYMSEQHKIEKDMFDTKSDFETSYINFYKNNFYALTWGPKKLNQQNESVNFLLEKFSEVARKGTEQEKEIVKSFFFGRDDRYDLKHLRILVEQRLDPESPYMKFFIKHCQQGMPNQLFNLDDFSKFCAKEFIPMGKIKAEDIVSICKKPDQNLTKKNYWNVLEAIIAVMKEKHFINFYNVLKYFLKSQRNLKLLSKPAAIIFNLGLQYYGYIGYINLIRLRKFFKDNLPTTTDMLPAMNLVNLIAIYHYLNVTLGFPSFLHQRVFGEILLKRINYVNNIGERTEALERLIFTKDLSFSLSDVLFRNALFSLYIETILTKHGKDTDNENSLKYFTDLIKRLTENLPKRDLAHFLSELSNAIEAQNNISVLIGKIVNPEKYFLTDKKTFEQRTNLVPLFSFLASSKENQIQMINFLSARITQESVDTFASYLTGTRQDSKIVTLFSNESSAKTKNLNCVLQLIHNQFWSQNLEERATLIDFLLIPTEEVLSVEKFNLAFTNAFDFVVKKLFPNALANANDPFDQENFAVTFLKAYLNTADRYQRNYLLAGMLVTTNEVDNEKKINVGRKLATLCEHLGPAYVKLAQAIHSYPQTPEDIRKELEHIKGRANPPKRWDLWRLITDVLPPEDQAKIERVGSLLGSASFNLALDVHLKDGSDVVLLLLRENAKKDAEQGFNHLRAAIDDCKHPLMTSLKSTALSLIDEAKELSIAEMDEKCGDTQGEIAKKLYGAFKNVQVDNYKVSIFPSTTLISGPGYRFITRVYGTEFNDLPQATARDKTIKKIIAKVIMQIELGNILRGDYFDCDRHGNQLRITTDFSKREINIGLYDFGEMALSKPTDEKMQQLAGFLSTVVSCLFRQKGLAVGLSEYIDKEIQAGKSVQYLMRVRKGLLALQDFQKHLTNQDLFEILNRLAAQQVIHPIIKYEFSKSLLLASGLFSLYNTVESGMRYVTQFFYHKRDQANTILENDSLVKSQLTK